MCVGKWHLGDQPEFLPTRHGFDHYVGLPYSNDMGGTGKPVLGKDGKEAPGRPPLPLLRDERVVEAPAEQDRLTALYTEEAVKFIDTNQDRPFFLYLRIRPYTSRSIRARHFRANRPMAATATGWKRWTGAPGAFSTRCAS